MVLRLLHPGSIVPEQNELPVSVCCAKQPRMEDVLRKEGKGPPHRSDQSESIFVGDGHKAHHWDAGSGMR
jgi:hypothetical protein